MLESWGVPGQGAYEGLHCQFEASQKCEDDSFYGGSIPLSLAMFVIRFMLSFHWTRAEPFFKRRDPATPIILAYEMNGTPLMAEHGGPLRVFAPGVIGARSVKWVQRIVISSDEVYFTPAVFILCSADTPFEELLLLPAL